MKLVTYTLGDGAPGGIPGEALGIVHEYSVFPLHALDPGLPIGMLELLEGGEDTMATVRAAYEALLAGRHPGVRPLVNPLLVAPIPDPVSCRDAYAFRQHVETSRLNRGLGMIPEFDEFPVFYFTNHRAIFGPGPVYCMPRHFECLDFELEVAVVLNRGGRNIPAAEADQYIAGFMIMNDLSARALQMEEMKLNLGPAKGKDFATVLGPWLVTPDELRAHRTDPQPGHVGQAYDLEMSCRVNGAEVSRGNFKDMHWTFAEIIERASYGVDLYPGDVIGSGTVGTGCFLELNGTGRRADPANFKEQWLQPGDEIEMEITGLGRLRTQVLLADATSN